MISIYNTKQKRVVDDNIYIMSEFRGLSTDTKPVTYTDENGKEFLVDNGSAFIELDTGDVFGYDLDSQDWNEL